MSTMDEPNGHQTSIITSSSFNAADADFILVSKDEVRFHVHRASLSYGSAVFKDMLAIGQSDDSTPSIQLEEDAATLESILPYLYPKSVPPLIVAFPSITNIVNACDKYHIERGIDAAREAYLAVASTQHDRGDSAHVKKLMHAFVFGDRFDQPRITDLTSQQLKRVDLSEIVDQYDNVICASFAATRLLRALTVRFTSYTRLRDECLEALARDLGRNGGRNCTRETVNLAYAGWIEATTYTNFFSVHEMDVSTDCGHCNSNALAKLRRLSAGFARVS